jgi:hypothetical protein
VHEKAVQRETGPSGPESSILVIQSGQPSLAVQAVDAARVRFPETTLSLLVRRDALAALPGWGDVEVIQNEGPRPSFVGALRARQFDRVVFLASGQPGFWKLQALAGILGAREVYAVDEDLRWIRVALRQPRAVLGLVARRVDPSTGRAIVDLWSAARSGAQTAAQAAARWLVSPLTLAALAAYERMVTAAARRRGAADWKRENRPGAGSRR